MMQDIPMPEIDPALAMCCGGAVCITVLLVGSIVSILTFYGVAAWISWRVFKALGIEIRKK